MEVLRSKLWRIFAPREEQTLSFLAVYDAASRAKCARGPMKTYIGLVSCPGNIVKLLVQGTVLPGQEAVCSLPLLIPGDKAGVREALPVQFGNFDGFVKSPYAALRCILRHCGLKSAA